MTELIQSPAEDGADATFSGSVPKLTASNWKRSAANGGTVKRGGRYQRIGDLGDRSAT